MKIRFDNNSVSGVNRKYRGFVLDIPGLSSVTVDVPSQYVNDAVSHLKYRHPAVICTPIMAEKPEDPTPVEEAPLTEQRPDTAIEEGETREIEADGEEAAPAEEEAEKEIIKANAAAAVKVKDAKGKAVVKEAEKKKGKKGGKK